MAIGRGTDPHFPPGRRNRQNSNAREALGIAQRLTIQPQIPEGLAAANAPDARPSSANISQPGFRRRFVRIGRKHTDCFTAIDVPGPQERALSRYSYWLRHKRQVPALGAIYD